MPIQQLAVLLLKGLHPMVFRLLPDILPHLFLSRLAHAESSIPILPRKSAATENILLNPSRRTAFDVPNGFTHGNGRWDPEQDVDMIGHATNQDGCQFVVAGDASQVR